MNSTEIFFLKELSTNVFSQSQLTVNMNDYTHYLIHDTDDNKQFDLKEGDSQSFRTLFLSYRRSWVVGSYPLLWLFYIFDWVKIEKKMTFFSFYGKN